MDTKRIIKKVAVLGAGGMGSLIACHFANAGLQVLLLDRAGDARLRNKPANDALAAALKSSPPPLYAKSFARNIATGNFEEDMDQVAGCDWILEATEGETDALQKLFGQVEQFRKPGTLITSATSDIHLHLITDGQSDDFKRHFCRTLFTNPPRYTQRLEITPTAFTLPGVVDILVYFGEKYLGKTVELTGHVLGLALSNYDQPMPGTDDFIRENLTLWKNHSTTITDIGDDIINLEFHTKMNTIGREVLEGINEAISMAEQNYRGLVICTGGENFSAGADLNLIAALINNNQFDALDDLINEFQQTMMRIRYSGIPVVAAPHQKALGAGCELCLHADKVVAHAELYMGLVEFGLGLIPAGGGTKELVLRLGNELQDGDIEVNNFRTRFLTIGQSKVSTSAHEAFELGYLKKGRDVVVMSKSGLLTEAKRHCLLLADEGYKPPVPRKDIRVLGKPGLGIGYQTAGSLYAGNHISGHDQKVAQKLAYVMAGADLSQPALVSEAYLLDLEREAFVSLCAEEKTQERIQSFLTGGKIVRN